MDGRRRVVQVARTGRSWLLTTRGARHEVAVMAPHIADLSKHMIDKVPPDMSRFLLAPMRFPPLRLQGRWLA
jgi:propionyl-CoA carboxylase alpha chain